MSSDATAGFEFVKTSTSAMQQSSVATTGTMPTTHSPSDRLRLPKVPEACKNQAHIIIVPESVMLDELPSISELIVPTANQVSLTKSSPNTRLTALRAALDRLNLPTYESQASDDAPRVSALRAAIERLTSSFEVQEHGSTSPQLIGDHTAIPSTPLHECEKVGEKEYVR